MANPALTDMLSGILLYLFKKNTNIGAVNNRAVTYPGLGAILKARVFAVIKAVLKPII